MENIITEEEFQSALNELAVKNRLIDNLLKHCSSFKDLPGNIRSLIDEELGIERVEIMRRKSKQN